MANNFVWDPSCKALWRFENGALTADSIGGNTLTASASSPTSDTSDYKEGGGCADFETDSTQYFYITDANLDAGFPLKSGDTVKKISTAQWFAIESIGFSQWLWSKYYSTGDSRSFGVFISAAGVLSFWCGYNGGVSGEYVVTPYTLQTGRWYHLSVAVDGIAKTIFVRLWDDTAQEVVYSGTVNMTNELHVENANFVIGDKQDYNQHYDGKTDELAVFSKLLTANEIDKIRQGIFGLGEKMISSTIMDMANWEISGGAHRMFLIF